MRLTVLIFGQPSTLMDASPPSAVSESNGVAATSDALATLAAKGVDLDQLAAAYASMDEAAVARSYKAIERSGRQHPPYEPPAPDGDYFDIDALITDAQRQKMAELRTFMETEVEPIINDAWLRDHTPRDVLIPGFRQLDLLTPIYGEDLETREPNGSVMEGLLTMEIARVDVSTATFFGVHSGLAMQSVLVCGSDEQKAEWLPKMRSWDLVGAG